MRISVLISDSVKPTKRLNPPPHSSVLVTYLYHVSVQTKSKTRVSSFHLNSNPSRRVFVAYRKLEITSFLENGRNFEEMEGYEVIHFFSVHGSECFVACRISAESGSALWISSLLPPITTQQNAKPDSLRLLNWCFAANRGNLCELLGKLKPNSL